MTTTGINVLQEPDLVELLADEPKLLALADAIALTQTDSTGLTSRPPRPGSRRLLVVAAAAALVLVAVGATLAATIGGFSNWLSGTPGTPASSKAQQQFRASNARSYASFPAGTVLHRLIVRRVDGATYRLYGFHYGDQLCLRLVVDGISGQPAISCAPSISLRGSRSPVQVADVDYPFGLGKPTKHGGTSVTISPHGNPPTMLFFPPAVSASFGFVADGVSAIVLTAGKQHAQAAVADNAFLAIRVHPATTSHVTAITATTARGRVTIPFATQPVRLGAKPPQQPIPGPKTVLHPVDSGSISWVLHHKPRGESLVRAHIPRDALVGFHQPGGIAFARVIAPDPQSTIRVVISLVGRHGHNLCILTVLSKATGGGCSVRLSPINAGEMYDLFQGGNQFEVISGLAGDSVARIELYLSDGERWPVPLRDNAFAIQAPRTKLPGELVAYDQAGQIIGITPERSL